ncbi:MAG: COX15/CtaA family protein [Rhodobacteraceae bacterium]|jgi:cytochrome c oxidase assembly protein subunit 15|nr:COX15/CtaA family protein [Paracoccaceae bacterium]
MAKRPIFEEAAAPGTRPAAAPPPRKIEAPQGARRAIRAWLWLLFGMVVAMIAVGGLTRLTDSGLSITEWRPVTGAMPPLNAADWQIEFDRYRQIDQYRLVNQGMTLGEFQVLYWWEWGHRQLGRLIGLVWAVGFAWFWLRRQIPTGWTTRLLIPGVLGGVQGAIGWWMVHSGLQEGMTAVASYRLATHLGLAFVILGVLAWYAFLLGRSESALLQARRAREGKLFSMSTGLMHFAFLQILLGALVAGIDAGRGYTDWPLMGGAVLPPGMFDLEPVWRNLFENDGTVQFIHRVSGYLLAVFGVVVWARGRRSSFAVTRKAFHWVLGAMAAQIVLGIVTVMHGAPVALGLSHQLLAVVLWVLILRARHFAQYPLGGTIRG